MHYSFEYECFSKNEVLHVVSVRLEKKLGKNSLDLKVDKSATGIELKQRA